MTSTAAWPPPPDLNSIKELTRDADIEGFIAGCFPTREVIGIHAVDLVWGLGTLHCMTQQEPA